MKEKTKVIVFKPSENVKKKMVEYYSDLKKDKTPPYAILQAMDADTTVTMYESGKVMFQGAFADNDFALWASLEKRHNDRDVEKELKNKKDSKDKKEKKKTDDAFDNLYLKTISTLGSDEVGTGDYFGPIIVSAAYVSRENISFLKELNVGDSKKTTDDRIKEIAPILMKKIPYTTLCLDNKDYNKIQDPNMNKIKAILHNKVLCSMLEKLEENPEKIVVDQFVNEKKYYEYITDAPKIARNILFLTKAEDQVLSVAAASIISRYLFLSKMDTLGNEIGKVIPLGAGTGVDEFAKNLVDEQGTDILNDYTKRNFKNTEKILINK